MLTSRAYKPTSRSVLLASDSISSTSSSFSAAWSSVCSKRTKAMRHSDKWMRESKRVRHAYIRSGFALNAMGGFIVRREGVMRLLFLLLGSFFFHPCLFLCIEKRLVCT